ncbi:MAG TPA: acyl-CoA synthetase [Gammaproteobacteria bacterium]|nr:acyl-CoA synthetase [Gammaproteobacteria bacterium]
MYPDAYSVKHPERPAFIMAATGFSVTYAEFEVRANRLAHLLRQQRLGHQDHYAIMMENNDRYLEACAAGERAGLYYTCINSYLTAEELAYILENSDSQILITSVAKLDVVQEAVAQCPRILRVLVVDAANMALPESFEDYRSACEPFPDSPIGDELLGTSMLYSSGTTGRPKGIIRPLPEQVPSDQLPIFGFLAQLWRYREDMVYLSPAPLYHSAPQAAVNLTIRHGGTVIIMERFDPEEYLALIERYQVSHSQLVPTMFSRMLKLSEYSRQAHDLSSLEIAIHAAAPCPAIVKQQMIDWWGPIIHEYYGATEGLGFAACDTQEWLAHPGTVGKIVLGELAVLDDDMNPMPQGEPGTLWFKTATEFEYHNDPEKTAEVTSADGEMTTVGDVGYLDADGFLYLTDRKTFMIISGGVNIYPQECEDLLISHPKVEDAAVFGVPNADLGEEVKAVVQTVSGIDGDTALAEELLGYLSDRLSRQKLPRSFDYIDEMPRLPTGKLYKRVLRDRYWGKGKSRIV